MSCAREEERGEEGEAKRDEGESGATDRKPHPSITAVSCRMQCLPAAVRCSSRTAARCCFPCALSACFRCRSASRSSALRCFSAAAAAFFASRSAALAAFCEAGRGDWEHLHF